MQPLAYQPMTLADLAGHLSGERDHDLRWRLVLEFLEEFNHESARAHLLAAEPRPTGDPHWDLLLAALAEHLSGLDGGAAPPWSGRPARMWAGSVWYVDPLPSARVWALAYSPAAFRRRGLFLHPDDLTRA